MKKITSLIIGLLSTSVLFSQFSITGPSYPPNSPVTCSSNTDVGIANFYDDGGAGGNYSPNANQTFTICPDIPNGTPKIRAAFGGMGLSWDVDPSDTLYIYDGPDATYPLIGAYNNATDPSGFGVVASWQNPTGCLTFVFHSDGANQATGWAANLACFSPPQPIEMHIEGYINGQGSNAMNPLDTGYVDICQGDSVLLVANPNFPYSLQNNGMGYSQTQSNVSYFWEFSDGSVANTQQVWFKPQDASGYFVSLMITDSYPHNTSSKCKIRVSTTPSFTGSGPLDPVVCFKAHTDLMGGVTPSDTVGVQVPGNAFQIGGEYAGLTFLPDGSNAEYTTDIHMSGFPAGSTLTNAGDIVSMCVNMEHSYLGDLEMWLVCPNGTAVTIFNSYTTGSIPGGFGGGNRFLGEPIDDSGGGGPGNGYDYCFSSVNNNWGSFAATFTTNTIPTPPTAPSPGQTMNPNGVYAPEDSFSGFAGCPLNGNWTLHVKDNWSIDDGYIFSWGIVFDPSLYPDNETYQNTITDSYWTPDPTIISGLSGDTNIVVQPSLPGTYSYTFNVTDNFGCHYDTTVQLIVLDTLINVNTTDISIYCFTDSAKVWSSATGTVPPFTFLWDNGTASDTAYYEALQNGTYDHYITVTDGCGFQYIDTATIIVNQTLAIDTMIQNPADCGLDNGWVSGSATGATGTVHYNWTGPGENNPNNTSASVWQDKPSGWYYFTITDAVCSAFDSIFIEQLPPPQADFTPTPQQGPAPLNVTFTNTSGAADSYDWDFGNSSGITVNNQDDQHMTYTQDGEYTVTLTTHSGGCSDQISKIIYVYLPLTYTTPNVFTPNGDGDNDGFTINLENAESLEIVIVNRWGNPVFESDDVNFVWNGKVNNTGVACTEGTYFFKFKATGSGDQVVEDHGFVHLIREK
ncbi:MAG: gliding motility-associated C-terminal domain-containing protein [Brumimicrobium sp.]|nr:gliding motility-associated C-terminal domain-containing protein [Brumimicrobium sp.]MCO5267676.1 gliding motility-associated C-terminal domain-containing protein [Brumimicrobium sp.]